MNIILYRFVDWLCGIWQVYSGIQEGYSTDNPDCPIRLIYVMGRMVGYLTLTLTHSIHHTKICATQRT